MAKELALGLVIGGAVSKSVGAAFKDVEGRVKRLDTVAGKAKVLQSVIGDTKRLQDEWRKAHTTGSSAAEGLRRKLDTNLNALRRQGVEVRDLGKAYEQMGRKAHAAELKSLGHSQLRQGGAGLRNTAMATAGAAATTMVMPTKVSADYGAVVRDIAIKAGIANKPEETQMSNTIIDTSRQTGMARNEVADVVNALVGAGMELRKALEYAPVAAKFVVGQGADGTDTAKMINALGQNAKITDPKDMQKALEAIAFQGQAGSFEAADMAKWFPDLLAGMGKLGIYGNDAVTQLGSMLQVQMKTAGSSDAAANNLKNWMEKIGTTDVKKAYKDAGIDYQASLNTGLQKGMSTLEASFALAQRYVEATDPKKAKTMSAAMEKISQETDPAKAKEMMASLEQALRTGDLFADMQVKAALTAYMQNKKLYQQLKKDSGDASGILEKNLAERRQTSAQKWRESGQAMDDALRSAGDAMQPLTDKISGGLTSVARSIASITDASPNLVTGLLAVGAAIATISAANSGLKIAKGIMNIGRGTLMGSPNLVQKVAVVNGWGSGADLGGGDGKAKRRGKRWGRRGKSEGTAYAPSSGPAKPRMRVYASGGPVESPKSLSGWKPPTTTPKPSATSLAPASAPRFGAIRSLPKGNTATALIDAALTAKDVYDTAETRDEKAEGYGTAAGTVAGTLAGAAAGAAIGSIVPIIGTAIGGLIGGYLGSLGGGALGGLVSKAAFGGPDRPEPAPSKPIFITPRPTPLILEGSAKGLGESGGVARKPVISAPERQKLAAVTPSPHMLMIPRPDPLIPNPAGIGKSFGPGPTLVAAAKIDIPIKDKPRAAPKLEQKNTFAPVFHIKVEGDVKDPRRLVNELMPEIERRLTDMAQQVKRRDMSDEPVY